MRLGDWPCDHPHDSRQDQEGAHHYGIGERYPQLECNRWEGIWLQTTYAYGDHSQRWKHPLGRDEVEANCRVLGRLLWGMACLLVSVGTHYSLLRPLLEMEDLLSGTPPRFLLPQGEVETVWTSRLPLPPLRGTGALTIWPLVSPYRWKEQ